MTRFARASGSKASNERAPEDGTPWEVMKEQLLKSKIESEESKKREQAEKQRIDNYEKFLKEQKVQKRPASWCDFPEVQKTVKKTKQSKPQKDINLKNEQIVYNVIGDQENKNELKKNNNKKSLMPQLEVVENKEPQVQEKNKKIKKKSKKNPETNGQEVNVNNQLQVEQTNNKNKKKKKKKQNNTSQSENGASGNLGNNTGIPSEQNNSQTENELDPGNKQKQNKNKKNKNNLVNGQPPRRKVIDDNSFQLIINGKEVELVRYDSFPIMKKDADRLNDLKANMIRRGIPKSEIQRNMKLERRRAEKALARLKRDVCYNCRKGGHNLSDCPELKARMPGAGGDGVCFKCGSTEHRQFECKVQKDKEFRFATCFICKEPGHIARQCPDNPKGLYPNGGGCKLCGDVTHLRKDCPTVSDKREESNIKLSTLDDGSLEGIAPAPPAAAAAARPDRKPKKISF